MKLENLWLISDSTEVECQGCLTEVWPTYSLSVVVFAGNLAAPWADGEVNLSGLLWNMLKEILCHCCCTSYLLFEVKHLERVDFIGHCCGFLHLLGPTRPWMWGSYLYFFGLPVTEVWTEKGWLTCWILPSLSQCCIVRYAVVISQ